MDDMNGSICETPAGQKPETYQSSIDQKVLLIVYAAVAAFIFIFIYVNCWSFYSHRLAQRLRLKYFQRLIHKDPAFFDRFHSGNVSSRLHDDIQAIQSGTCEKVGIVVASISFFITAFAIAFIKLPRLAGMLISAIPAFLLLATVGGAIFVKFSTAASDAVAHAISIASEALNNIALTQVLGASSRLEAKFTSHLIHAKRAGIKKVAIAAFQAGMLYFIAYSSNALAFWQGSRNIATTMDGTSRGASIGEVYTVVFVVIEGEWKFRTLAIVAQTLLTLFSLHFSGHDCTYASYF